MDETSEVKSVNFAQNDLNSFFSLLRVFAIHPLDGAFNVKYCLLLYCVLAQSLIFVLGVYLSRLEFSNDAMITVLYVIEIELLVLNSLILGIGYIRQRNQIKNYFNELLTVDETLYSVSKKCSYVNSTLIFSQLFFNLGTVTVLLVSAVLCLSQGPKHLIGFISYFLCFYNLELHVMVFKIYTIVLCKRFELTAWCLTNLPPSAFLLQSLARVHQNLIEVAHKLNSIFSFQLLVLLMTEFYFITSSAYSLVWEISRGSQRMTNAEVYLVVGWLFLYLKQVSNIVYPVARMVSKAEEFTFSLDRMLMNDDSGQLTNCATIRLYTVMRKTVKFTAYGYFPIGYPVITAIVGTATTYLVVLLQLAPPGKA